MAINSLLKMVKSGWDVTKAYWQPKLETYIHNSWLPQQIISDNGLQFVPDQFAQFLKEWY